MADYETGVLEIGPGIGCLTEQLSLRAGKVVALEVDRRLQPLLKETLSSHSNVKLVFADAMKIDIRKMISDEFQGLRPIAELSDFLDLCEGRDIKVVPLEYKESYEI